MKLTVPAVFNCYVWCKKVITSGAFELEQVRFTEILQNVRLICLRLQLIQTDITASLPTLQAYLPTKSCFSVLFSHFPYPISIDSCTARSFFNWNRYAGLNGWKPQIVSDSKLIAHCWKSDIRRSSSLLRFLLFPQRAVALMFIRELSWDGVNSGVNPNVFWLCWRVRRTCNRKNMLEVHPDNLKSLVTRVHRSSAHWQARFWETLLAPSTAGHHLSLLYKLWNRFDRFFSIFSISSPQTLQGALHFVLRLEIFEGVGCEFWNVANHIRYL